MNDTFDLKMKRQLIRSFSRYTNIRQQILKDEVQVAEPALKEPKIPLLKRLGKYVLQIADDYKLALKDVGSILKEKPLKSGVFLTALGTTIYSARTNPSEVLFRDHLVKNSNDLLRLGDPIRNTRSNTHMQNIWHWYNTGQIKRLNIGVCSFMWIDDHSSWSDLYKTQCYPLKVGWLDMPERIIDIGAFGKWWWMEKAMIDYDIHEEDWENAPTENTASDAKKPA